MTRNAQGTAPAEQPRRRARRDEPQAEAAPAPEAAKTVQEPAPAEHHPAPPAETLADAADGTITGPLTQTGLDPLPASDQAEAPQGDAPQADPAGLTILGDAPGFDPEGALAKLAQYDDGSAVFLDSHTGGAHPLGAWGGLSLRFVTENTSTVRHYAALDLQADTAVAADVGDLEPRAASDHLAFQAMIADDPVRMLDAFFAAIPPDVMRFNPPLAQIAQHYQAERPAVLDHHNRAKARNRY